MVNIYTIIAKLLILISRNESKSRLSINQKYPSKKQLIEYLGIEDEEWQYVVKLLRTTKLFTMSDQDVITFDNWKEYNDLLNKIEFGEIGKPHAVEIKTPWILEFVNKNNKVSQPYIVIKYYKSRLGYDKDPNWNKLFEKSYLYVVIPLIKKLGIEEVMLFVKWCIDTYSYKFNFKYLNSYYMNYSKNAKDIEPHEYTKQDQALSKYQ